MNELSDSHLARQDFVDNSIYNLVCDLNPSQQKVEWNIELIGGIRDLIGHWFVRRLAISDEMAFYPYITTKS